MYCRKCEECGNIQEAKPPQEYKGDSWRDLKCRKCGSTALDYGHSGYERVDGKIRRIVREED